jgi:hypothetical protein
LFVISLEQALEYEALSYTWGDPSFLFNACLDGVVVESGEI